MKKFRVIWFKGCMSLHQPKREDVLKTMEVEADSIETVNFIQILPEQEREDYAVSIQYAVRTSWHSGELKDAKETVSDYGSHSKFIYVEEI